MTTKSQSVSLISGSGELFLTPGNKSRKRWSYNIDILHPNGEIYALSTVIYGDGSVETILPTGSNEL